MPKIKQSVVERVVDENGKVKERRENKTLSWGEEPSYIKFYLDDILYLSDIPSKHEKVLYELLKKATYAGESNGMEVVINSSLKRRIAQKLGVKNIGSISNAITDLVKGEVLHRIDVGIYQFNPYLFGKGDWQDISRLRLEVNYDNIKGKTFKAVCEYKDKENKAHTDGKQEEFNSTEEFDRYMEDCKKAI